MSATLRARPLDGPEQQAYAAARLHAVHALMPYMAAAVFRLQPWAVDGLGTFAVDASWRVYVDPLVLEEWGVPAAAGVLLHEVGHAIRDHAGVAEQLGPELDRFVWNLCGDAAINDDLVAAGVPLPGHPVLPADLTDRRGLPMRDGWTALQYYDALPEQSVGLLDPEARAPGAGVEGPVARVAGRPSSPDASCGAVAGGDAHDVQLPPGAEGVAEIEQRLTRRVVAQAVAAAPSLGRGSAPAGLQRWARDELAPSVVPWQQLLRGAVRSGVAHAAGSLETTYARPSRRRVPGVVLPGSRRPLPAVAIVVDTSASMDEALLDAAMAEVEAIARSVGASGDLVRVLAVDAEVHEATSVRRAADVLLRGGGGTNLTPGLVAAVRGRPRPDVVVVITDGFTPWPAARPAAGTRFVVVLLEGPALYGTPPTPPSWASTVEVPRAQAAA